MKERWRGENVEVDEKRGGGGVTTGKWRGEYGRWKGEKGEVEGRRRGGGAEKKDAGLMTQA